MSCLFGALLKEKSKTLHLTGAHFMHMSTFDSLIIKCHSFAIQRLQYLLWSAPCFLSIELSLHDDTQWKILGCSHQHSTCRWQSCLAATEFASEAWWLGISRTSQVATSSCLTSVAASVDLVCVISSTCHWSLPASLLILLWPRSQRITCSSHHMTPPLANKKCGMICLWQPQCPPCWSHSVMVVIMQQFWFLWPRSLVPGFKSCQFHLRPDMGRRCI